MKVCISDGKIYVNTNDIPKTKKNKWNAIEDIKKGINLFQEEKARHLNAVKIFEKEINECFKRIEILKSIDGEHAPADFNIIELNGIGALAKCGFKIICAPDVFFISEVITCNPTIFDAEIKENGILELCSKAFNFEVDNKNKIISIKRKKIYTSVKQYAYKDDYYGDELQWRAMIKMPNNYWPMYVNVYWNENKKTFKFGEPGTTVDVRILENLDKGLFYIHRDLDRQIEMAAILKAARKTIQYKRPK